MDPIQVIPGYAATLRNGSQSSTSLRTQYLKNAYAFPAGLLRTWPAYSKTSQTLYIQGMFG